MSPEGMRDLHGLAAERMTSARTALNDALDGVWEVEAYNTSTHGMVVLENREPAIVLAWGDGTATALFDTVEGTLRPGGTTEFQRRVMAARLRYHATRLEEEP